MPRCPHVAWAVAAVSAVAVGSTVFGFGCISAEHAATDFVMASAYRAPAASVALANAHRSTRFRIVAGDTHVHVLPPDDPSHVARNPAQTIALAREEKLDFVILTPHVPAGFFMHPGSSQRNCRVKRFACGRRSSRTCAYGK